MYTNNLYCSYEFRSGIKSQSICTSTTKFTLARLLAKIYIYTDVYSKSFTVSAREVEKCLGRTTMHVLNNDFIYYKSKTKLEKLQSNNEFK